MGMRERLIVALGVAALGAIGSANAAPQARIWVSGKGQDTAGCGSPVSPCRTLQFAHDNVSSGGQIDILDPAGYGAIKITKAVRIVNDGVGTASVLAQAGLDAISISAGPNDAIFLRGLNIDGGGVGHRGIDFLSGGSLEVMDTGIRYFSGNGIALEQSAVGRFRFKNVIASENGGDGLIVIPQNTSSANVVIHDSTFSHNSGSGVNIDASSANVITMTLSDSAVDFNQVAGVNIGTVQNTTNGDEVILDNVTITHNPIGVAIHGAPSTVLRYNMFIGRSLMSYNATCLSVAFFGGAISSYGDNYATGNGIDNFGALATLIARQ